MNKLRGDLIGQAEQVIPVAMAAPLLSAAPDPRPGSDGPEGNEALGKPFGPLRGSLKQELQRVTQERDE
ncbi:unnamed protein product, partial [Protopolystoma xenopodis]